MCLFRPAFSSFFSICLSGAVACVIDRSGNTFNVWYVLGGADCHNDHVAVNRDFGIARGIECLYAPAVVFDRQHLGIDVLCYVMLRKILHHGGQKSGGFFFCNFVHHFDNRNPAVVVCQIFSGFGIYQPTYNDYFGKEHKKRKNINYLQKRLDIASKM